MFPLSFLILVVLVSGLFTARPTLATSASHGLQGAYYFSAVQIIRVFDAVMRFLRNLLILVMVLVGLFVVTLNINRPILGIHPHMFTIAVLGFAVTLTFASMYMLKAVTLTLGEARRQVEPLARLLSRVPLIVKPRRWWLFPPLAFVNPFWLLVSVPLQAVGGMLTILLRLMATAERIALWLSRLWALINLGLIVLMGLFTVDYITGLGIMDGTTVMIVFFFVAIPYLSFSLIMDWFIPLHGGFVAATVGYLVTLLLAGFILFAHVDPVLADGVGHVVKNAHDYVAEKVSWSGAATTPNRYPMVRARQEIRAKDLYFRQGERGNYTFVPLGGPDPEAVIVKANDVGAMAMSAQSDNSTPTVMSEVYFPDGSDPRMLQIKTRLDRHFWVPKSLLSIRDGESGQTVSQTTVDDVDFKKDSLEVCADKDWQDTGIKVPAGAKISVDSRGSVCWDPALPCVGPRGTFPASAVQRSEDFLDPYANCGALLLRIGTEIYQVGEHSVLTSNKGGKISLAVNDRRQSLSDNSGSFRSRIKVD